MSDIIFGHFFLMTHRSKVFIHLTTPEKTEAHVSVCQSKVLNYDLFGFKVYQINAAGSWKFQLEQLCPTNKLVPVNMATQIKQRRGLGLYKNES